MSARVTDRYEARDRYEPRGTGASAPLTVELRALAPIVAWGLTALLGEDQRLRVLVADAAGSEHEHGSVDPKSQVVIVGETADASASARLIELGSGVMVVARQPTRSFGMLLLAAGVSCIDLEASESNIRAAVSLAAEGGCTFVSGNGAGVRQRRPGAPRVLTKREIQVLVGLSNDVQYSAIALELGISAETARKHARKLLDKLEAPRKKDVAGLPVHWFGLGESV
jgi:DNA-binding NarL/FixJ family response regulator